jgi:hypothetical protein
MGHVAAQESAPRESEDEVAGYRIRELAIAREPTLSPKTRGGSRACPMGG